MGPAKMAHLLPCARRELSTLPLDFRFGVATVRDVECLSLKVTPTDVSLCRVCVFRLLGPWQHIAVRF